MLGAGVKESLGRKVVEVDAAVSIIGIKPILVAHVQVVDPMRVSEAGERTSVATFG